MRWRLASSSASTCEIRVRTDDWRPSLDSRSLASAWILALWYWPWMLAACDCCSSSSLFRRTFRLARSASAPRNCSSASSSSCSTRSSRNSRMIVSALMMLALGSVTMRSTVASVAAVIHRMSSGTSVPGPADLPQHRAALGRVAPRRRGFHSGRRRLQLRQADGDQHADQQGGHAKDDALDLLFASRLPANAEYPCRLVSTLL